MNPLVTQLRTRQRRRWAMAVLSALVAGCALGAAVQWSIDQLQDSTPLLAEREALLQATQQWQAALRDLPLHEQPNE